MKGMDWILASASPRRKELFGEVVETFEIIVAKGEENASGDTPDELVRKLALQKATEVSALPQAQGKAVLGADTVVALNGEILGKPKDEADARRMLRALSGRAHEVYTGVCMLYPDEKGGNKSLVKAECTKVFFRALSEEFMERYIQSGSPMDKAGAYGIQDGNLVEKIEGSFTNVVGLPVELCKEMLKELEK